MRIATALAAFAVPVLACECRLLTVCELVQQPTLFIGEVISGGVTIREDPWFAAGRRVRFRVLESFRGLPPGAKTVDVEVMGPGGNCRMMPYFEGGRYLVAPQRGQDGGFYEGLCPQGRDVVQFADDVAAVRNYFARSASPMVRGRVVLGLFGQPLEAVRISASRKGGVFSTSTDADGKYTLPLPEGGPYSIQAALRPYALREGSSVVSVPARGCAIQNFSMTIDSSISGKVSAAGAPLKTAVVGLIDLNRPSQRGSPVSFRQTYTKDDLSYTFKDVAVGRYQVVLNPEGPQLTGFNLPVESTYYPGGSARGAAKVIEIKSGGVHLTNIDLTTGPKIEFRKVTVRTWFSDGKPMETALVRITAAPLRAGEPPWTDEQWTPKRNVLELTAPADRKLHIEMSDNYGRKLNGTYTADYEAGTAPIVREFVVRP